MTLLSVNLNKICLLRNSRATDIPNPQTFAEKACAAGVKAFTLHPRPDARHATCDDVKLLSELKKSQDFRLTVEANPLMAATLVYPGLREIVKKFNIKHVTLVSDDESKLTSDGGWTAEHPIAQLRNEIAYFNSIDVSCALFIDAEVAQVELAHKLGCSGVELYTGPFAQASDPSEHLSCLIAAANTARELGMEVNAGHDLNLDNLPVLLDNIKCDEISIGHALTVDALTMGWEQAIKEYLKICHRYQ